MENNNTDEDDDDDFPLNSLFAPMEKIFADFERFFSGFSMIFSIPSDDFNNENSQPSTSLRDEVLKNANQNNRHGDENLDVTIEQHGLDNAFPRAFSNSSLITTIQREPTPSGHCIIEKKVQRSSNENVNNITETISKICGEKYHTTIKQDGQILREYGNSTLDELNEIDSNQPIIGGNRHSDFFKKLFS